MEILKNTEKYKFYRNVSDRYLKHVKYLIFKNCRI